MNPIAQILLAVTMVLLSLSALLMVLVVLFDVLRSEGFKPKIKWPIKIVGKEE